MKKPVSLVTLVLVLFASVAYASPCTDRRLTCSAEFAEAVRNCNNNETCVEKAHKTYMSCLATDNCGY